MSFIRPRRALRIATLVVSGCWIALGAGPAFAQIGNMFDPASYGNAIGAGSAASGTAFPRPAITSPEPAQDPTAVVLPPTPASAPKPPATESNTPKPSEFQKFVQATTGRQLPVFGSRFFGDAGSSVTTVDGAPVSADYVVGVGDELAVRIWGSVDGDVRTRVDRNGQISLPRIGTFTVAGVRASDLERHLRAQIGRVYTNFNLNVSLGQLHGVKVFVVGPARLPGLYTLSSPATMLSAVVAAGGPAPNGSMRKVLLRRNGTVVSELDIYDFLVQGDKSKDVQLAGGDVVVFQPAGPRVALNGAIDTPAVYELKAADEPVREVLRYAGGPAVLANPNRVQVERIDARQSPAARFVEQFKLDETGMQKPLRDGDVVTLLAISPQFANAVTLRGHVAQPLRYPYTPGMRIRDLIPDKDALISPDFFRRKNLLVQNVESEDSMAPDARQATGPRVEPNATLPGVGSPPTGNPSVPPAAPAAQERKAPTALFSQLNWDYAVVERLNEKDLSTEVIPFNLGKAVLQGDSTANIELRAGDVVTVFSQQDIRVPVSRQTRLVSLEGEVGAPGVYQLQPGETIAQLITRAGGFTPHAYVYGLEFTREETRKKQQENLAAAISRLEALSATQNARQAANQRDDVMDRTNSVSAAATQAQLSRLRRVQPNGRIALELPASAATVTDLPDLPLEQSDRIVVPARPGFITVAGAVVNTNALLWKRGRTVDDYLKQVGVDEGAEVSNMFVLRADGTVRHAQDSGGFLGWGGLSTQTLEPGDAIIVPSQLDYETWGRALMRGLKDWSQIFAQFGLGAAAIQALRTN
jgi:protein involved in polysaccharide export with SLBB domain